MYSLIVILAVGQGPVPQDQPMAPVPKQDYRMPTQRTRDPIWGNYGILIRSVQDHGPAWYARLESGDILVSYSPTMQKLNSIEALKRALQPNQPVDFTIIDDRNGQYRSVRIWPNSGKMGITAEVIDLTNYNDRTRQQYNSRQRTGTVPTLPAQPPNPSIPVAPSPQPNRQGL